MAKQTKTAGEPVKLGRSAVTGKFVLKPVAKRGGSVSQHKMREVTRTVLAQKKA